ncbi:MAG: ATP-binding cassette domain-containing protein [Fibromonadaceae bacterium]|jgi:ATPase subunit of ABC transporter with duplicated ATPase domains|nr:ATP-binding cassette domain-containing protein [Fibromonadaceae bacterium]
MASIKLQNISFRYNAQKQILSNATIHLTDGWASLTGENGCGKSTLLKLLLGLEKPDSGTIQIEPPNVKIHYCEQELSEPNQAILEFALDYENFACRLRSMLKIDAEMLERWQTLSPGEQKRWQIGAALNAECDILFLDEPSNHLDSESMELMLSSLKKFNGVGIIISHNRMLLNSLTNATMCIFCGNLQLCKLPYSEAKAIWELELQEQKNIKETAQKELKNIKRKLQKEREKQEKGAAHHKEKSTKSLSDSRTITAGNVASWAEARVSKNIGILRDKKEKMEHNTHASDRTQLGRSIFMEYEQPSKSTIFNIRSQNIMAGNRIVLPNFNFELKRGEHVWLKGANGAGKTTLIKHLLKTTIIEPQKLLYLPQVLNENSVIEIISKIKALDSKELGRIMNILAALGCSPSILESGTSMSPGEARKLHLAFGMGKFVWALLLDEPTNHLDLQSIERLETALKIFPGALLLISHDNVFAENCSGRVVGL